MFCPSFHSRILTSVLLCCLLATGCVSALSPLISHPGGPAEQAQTDAWIRGLSGLTPMEQARQAELVWRDASKPQMLRDRAAYILSTRPSSQALTAQRALSQAYAAATPAQKAAMERLLMADLLTTDDAALRLLGNTPKDQQKSFPWSLITWRAAKRGLLTDNAGILQRLSDPRLYADPSLLGMATPAKPAPAGTTSLAGTVALVLPLSGPYAAIGKQVAAGADIAAQTLSARGLATTVRIIDTERPDWLGQLAALPSDCVTIGGPLRADSYTAMRTRGLTGRALFAFLPQLPKPADEGSTVWRFFTSPRDQIDAVLNFASRDLGIKSYGVLAPEDPYGQRMSGLFLQATQQRGLTATTGAYSPADMKSWTKSIGDFVGAVAMEQGSIPRANATFDAIFLPDGWKNMDMLISTLHYHGANKMVMLGTELWEQSLTTVRGLNPATFALTIFPGVWDATSTAASAVDLRNGMTAHQNTADDWAVLGFDFVQFAAALGLKDPQALTSLNSRLASGVAVDWAGAPITWNNQGQASRALFLFQPSSEGMTLLNRDTFIQYRSGSGSMPNNAAPAQSAPDQPNNATGDAVNSTAQSTGSPAGTGASGSPAQSPDITDLVNAITGSKTPAPPAN